MLEAPNPKSIPSSHGRSDPITDTCFPLMLFSHADTAVATSQVTLEPYFEMRRCSGSTGISSIVSGLVSYDKETQAMESFCKLVEVSKHFDVSEWSRAKSLETF